MGILADRLESMCVESSSPDGQITGEFRPPGNVWVCFKEDTYHHYRERTLERQLSDLMGRWWASYLQARSVAVAEATGQPAIDYEPWNSRERKLLAEREQTVFEGMSERQTVFVRSTGLRQWQVVVRDGCLNTLDETEFGAELSSGFGAMMRDYHGKSAQLRDKYLPR